MTKTEIIKQINGVFLKQLTLVDARGKGVFSNYFVNSQRTPEEFLATDLQEAEKQFIEEVGLCQAND